MKYLPFLLCLAAIGLCFGVCRASDLPVTDQILPDGVRILVQQEPDTQLVAINVFVRTAGAPEEQLRPGLANLVARTLLMGTSNQNSATLSEQINILGGNVTSSWDRNFTQVRALTLASQFTDSAYLISDVLKNASFSDGDVQQAKQDLLQQFEDQSDDVYQQTYDQLLTKLYEGQGIDPASLGSASVIASLRPADLKAFFQKYYTADNIVISIVGNIDPNDAVKTFATDMTDFNRHSPRRAVSWLSYTPKPLSAPVTVKSYRGDLNGGYVMVGYLVPGAGSQDYPALLLLNALLGGMKTGLLFTDLREKMGLGYETLSVYGEDVGTTDLMGYILSPGDKPASSAAPKTQTIADSDDDPPSSQSSPSFGGVKDALIDQFRLLRSQPPTPQMLERAKKFVEGSYLIRHERLLDRAYWLGFSEIALTPLGGYQFDTHFADKIDAVTAAQVQQVAQKYLSNGYVVSMVLPGDPNAGQESR